MRIDDKIYCDVCLEKIDRNSNDCLTCNFDDVERHYCGTHRIIGDLLQEAFIHGKDIENLISRQETKGVSNLEVYDILSSLFVKHFNYMINMSSWDKDIKEYYKKNLETDVAYNRLIAKGVIKDDNQRKGTEN